VDTYERPELCLGSYEFVATKDYCKVRWLELPGLVALKYLWFGPLILISIKQVPVSFANLCNTDINFVYLVNLV